MQTPPFNGKILKERVAVFKPPYTITGVYCFEPVTINQYKQTRTSNSKQTKRFGVLFTCLTTNAVHLELSIDMTTDSFLMPLQRFIAQRRETDIM